MAAFFIVMLLVFWGANVFEILGIPFKFYTRFSITGITSLEVRIKLGSWSDHRRVGTTVKKIGCIYVGVISLVYPPRPHVHSHKWKVIVRLGFPNLKMLHNPGGDKLASWVVRVVPSYILTIYQPCTKIPKNINSCFWFPLIGGGWYIITQLAVYTTYIPLRYGQLGDSCATTGLPWNLPSCNPQPCVSKNPWNVSPNPPPSPPVQSSGQNPGPSQTGWVKTGVPLMSCLMK